MKNTFQGHSQRKLFPFSGLTVTPVEFLKFPDVCSYNVITVLQCFTRKDAWSNIQPSVATTPTDLKSTVLTILRMLSYFNVEYVKYC